MIFDKEMLSFCILDVMESNKPNTRVNGLNIGRNFDALSFRFDSDSILETESEVVYTKANYITYVPARLNYRRISTKDHLIVIHFEASNYHSQSIEYMEAENPEKFAALFKKILSVWNEKSVGYQYKCASIFYEILAECYAQSYKAPQNNSKIQSSVDYILKNYKRNDISMSEIAKRSFISEVYFRKIFKKEFGISPQKYIVGLRMQNAAGLIVSGYYTLKEVACMSGYKDYKYFSIEFKKHIGVSPSEYSYNFYKI